jgi:hypothetical protein
VNVKEEGHYEHREICDEDAFYDTLNDVAEVYRQQTVA